MKTRLERASGTSGELSPLLAARVQELARAAAADARLENLTPLPEGARTRTPGTRFVAAWKDETRPGRLLPFEASSSDTYMLAFNGGAMRVFRQQAAVVTGTGSPYELAHDFTDAQIEKLFTAQVRGTMFIASGAKPRVLTRQLDDDWTLAPYETIEAPVRLQNTDQAKTIQASGTTGSITLTANFPAFLAGHVGSVWRLDENDFADIPAWKAIETPITVGAKRRNKGRIYEVTVLNSASGDTGPNPPVHDAGEVFSSGGNVTWKFLSYSGGYVRIDAVASSTSATATVLQRLPDQVTTKPSYRWFEAAWSDVRGWPTAVSVVDQSLVWLRDNEVWISRASDLYSFDLMDEEDSAINLSINAPDGRLVEIVWVLPAGVLVIGTRSGEWVIRGQSTYERLTATNARAVPQGSKGSLNGHQPAMINGGAAFIGEDGRRLHFARFDAVTEQVEFAEFTTFSRHMLRGRARQLAWCSDPHPVLWARLANGTLCGVTLLPEQDVIGWQRRPFLNGKVLQIGAIRTGDSRGSELWLGIERVINGQTRRYWEVQQPYFEALDEDAPDARGAWFLDCALSTSAGAGPFTYVTGLAHLEGQEVGIFAEGRMLPRQIVSDGKVTLPGPMRNIIVGLPQRWLLKTLPFETNSNKGSTKGTIKTSSSISLQLYESASGEASSGSGGEPLFPTGGATPAAPIALFTGTKNATVEPISEYECIYTLSGDDALPFTLLGMVAEIALKDP